MILEYHLLSKIVTHYYLQGHQNLKNRYDHSYNYNYNYNHIHFSGIQPLAATHTKLSWGELNDPASTAENKAQAMQQHLGSTGKIASLAKTRLYQDHKGDLGHFA